MKFFSLSELEKIKEYAGDASQSAMRAASAMSQESFRFPDGSTPAKEQIDMAFKESRVASMIFRKTLDRIDRMSWPVSTGYLTV